MGRRRSWWPNSSPATWECPFPPTKASPLTLRPANRDLPAVELLPMLTQCIGHPRQVLSDASTGLFWATTSPRPPKRASPSAGLDPRSAPGRGKAAADLLRRPLYRGLGREDLWPTSRPPTWPCSRPFETVASIETSALELACQSMLDRLRHRAASVAHIWCVSSAVGFP